MRVFGIILAALALPATASAQVAPKPVIASDVHTEFSLDGKKWSPAIATWTYPGWPMMKEAQWIWITYKVAPTEALNGSPVVTFRRSFMVKEPGRATLQITADNAYEARFDGQLLGSNGALDAKSSSDQDWHTFDTYDVVLRPGLNILTIRAVNYHSPGATNDPEMNPGGLIYKLTVAPTLAKTLAAGSKAEVYGIHFDTDKSVIKPDSKPVLNELAALLTTEPRLKVEISGHTDSTGGSEHNIALSKQRAAAVVTALSQQYGIDPERMNAAGFGDTRPVADNGTPEGRTQNRRVEIRKIP
jgi:outer membrane protein OmpA-like peptidoglycan-associated protein